MPNGIPSIRNSVFPRKKEKSGSVKSLVKFPNPTSFTEPVRNILCISRFQSVNAMKRLMTNGTAVKIRKPRMFGNRNDIPTVVLLISFRVQRSLMVRSFPARRADF